MGSTALELDPYTQRVASEMPEKPELPEVHQISYQRSLFSGAHRVMELPVQAVPARRTASAERGSRTSRQGQSRARKSAGGSPVSQQRFAFEDLAAQESVPLIYCDAPVANPMHRATAFFLDASMIFAALGVFLVTFELCGGEVILRTSTIPLYLGILVVISLFYKLLFCVCGSDTPGMIWTQLRLLNFDGRVPDREERLSRLFGTFLSCAAGGLGLVWALVDEEQLAWHDHISKTFPTPYYR